MRYRDFEFFASPKDGEIRCPSDTSTTIKKTFFCEIYHAEDEGMANLLDSLLLKEGRDIPVNFEPGLIAALQRYVDTHYEELMATHEGRELSPQKDYLTEFLHNTDFDLLYKQKQALLSAQDRHLPVDNETLEGLVNFLDFIGDWAEQEGVFTYPSFEEKSSLVDELISLAKEELNDVGKISYVAPNNEYVINIIIKRGSEDCINPDKEFYWLQLLQPTEKGLCQRFSGGTDYNDFATLRELAESAISYWDRRKELLKPALDSQISSASGRTCASSTTFGKTPEHEIS